MRIGVGSFYPASSAVRSSGSHSTRFSGASKDPYQDDRLADNPREVKQTVLSLLKPETAEQARINLKAHTEHSWAAALREGTLWAMHDLAPVQKAELITALVDYPNEHIYKALSDGIYFLPMHEKGLIVSKLASQLTPEQVPVPDTPQAYLPGRQKAVYQETLDAIKDLPYPKEKAWTNTMLHLMDQQKVSIIRTPTPAISDLKTAKAPLASLLYRVISKDPWGRYGQNKLTLAYYQGRLGRSEGLALFRHEISPLLTLPPAR